MTPEQAKLLTDEFGPPTVNPLSVEIHKIIYNHLTMIEGEDRFWHALSLSLLIQEHLRAGILREVDFMSYNGINNDWHLKEKEMLNESI